MAKITHDTAEVWQGWQQRELRIAHCQACGTWVHPPRRICPECWSDDVHADVAGGTGHLLAFSFPRPAPDATEPIVTGVVALDDAEGVRLLAPIVDCARDDVRTGMALSLTWGDANVPQFRPAERAQ
ncbi:MAG TPA: zinc ribbon domain-containing protein [Mycobacteriales bacterium]|nr:zinc ribbon domain-containing protein [Mycobacteriales bacterium]